MEQNQSDMALPDISEAEQLGVNEVENDNENTEQVNNVLLWCPRYSWC